MQDMLFLKDGNEVPSLMWGGDLDVKVVTASSAVGHGLFLVKQSTLGVTIEVDNPLVETENFVLLGCAIVPEMDLGQACEIELSEDDYKAVLDSINHPQPANARLKSLFQ